MLLWEDSCTTDSLSANKCGVFFTPSIIVEDSSSGWEAFSNIQSSWSPLFCFSCSNRYEEQPCWAHVFFWNDVCFELRWKLQSLCTYTLSTLCRYPEHKSEDCGFTLSKCWLLRSLTPRFWMSTFATMHTNLKISLIFELDPNAFFFIDGFKHIKPFRWGNLIRVLLKSIEVVDFPFPIKLPYFLNLPSHFLTRLVVYDSAYSF